MHTPSARPGVLSRSLLVLSAAVLVLTSAACSSQDTPPSAAGTDGSADTVVITDQFGEVTIPAAPQRVVALDENVALNLLTAGITPIAAFQGWGNNVAAAVLEEAGVEVIPMTTGTYYPDVEEVAAYDPDLLAISGAGGAEETAALYEEIAPVLRSPYSVPWRDVVTDFGAYFGTEDEAATIISRLEEKAAAIAEQNADDPQSVTLLMGTVGESLAVTDSENQLDSVLEDAGFTRPDADLLAPDQSQGEGWNYLSAEQLPEHDADIVLVTSGLYYNVDLVQKQPLYQELSAVVAGRSALVSGDMYTAGNAFGTYWVLEDLQGFVDGDFTESLDEAAADRWADFEDLVR